ncbi:MAG: hypothetical protein KatS3mg004_2632 [Bryobacteraceae bacterium]|nr:MAG: hypothetical protein KatS3mg004_2632 [Bryobacteraceae bacterium]
MFDVRPTARPDRKAGWLLASAAAALWLAVASPEPVRELPTTTQRFFCYFSSLKQSGRALSLWDRLTISLVLAGREAPPRERREESSRRW